MTDKQPALIKSRERVKNYGEVYTPVHIINGMLDMIPDLSIEMTFFEPACGNGNFVVEILKRKFDLCKTKQDYITALNSVVAIDLMADNVEECKQRVKALYNSYGRQENIDFILDTQIFQGNALAIMRLLGRYNGGRMTDKEQIMIDTNKYFVEIIDESRGTIGYNVVRPERLLMDIIKQNKQLARKTQECEELKSESFTRESLISMQEEEIDRYRKALEEIEGIIKQTKQQVFCQHCAWYNTDGCDPSDKICGDFIKILDIINKAKGE